MSRFWKKKPCTSLSGAETFNQMKPSYITFEYLLEIILKMYDENKCVNTFKIRSFNIQN